MSRPEGRRGYFSRLSVSRKLVLVIMTVCAAGILAAGVALTAFNIWSYHRWVVQDFRTEVRIVAANCAGALAFDDPEDGVAVLQSLGFKDSVKAAYLYRGNGNLFAVYARPGEAVEHAPEVPSAEGVQFADGLALATAAVDLGERRLGWVTLQYDAGLLGRFINTSVVVTLGVTLLVCAGALLLSNRLQRVVSAPIVELTSAVRRVSESGDYGVRVEPRGGDELGVLATAFNEMLGQIRQRERDLRFTRFSVDRSSDAGFWMRPDGRLVYVNEAACASLGYPRSELLRMSVFDVDPNVVPETWASHWREIKTRGSVMVSSDQRARDGRVFPVEITSNYLVFEGQEFACAFARDVTEKRAAEAALRDSEARFRNVFESSPLGMHMYRLEDDGRLVFTAANPAADAILGVDNAQFVGKTIEDAFPSLAFTEVPERYRRAAASGEPWSTDQIVYEDARVVGAYEVRAFQTVPGRMVAMFADVTERRRAMEALRLRERFLGSLAEVSRELLQARNPVDVLPGILKRIGEVTGVSRVCLVENGVAADGSITLAGRFDWTTEGVENCTLDSGELGVSYETVGLARWIDVLGGGGVISGPTGELPRSERSFLIEQGIQSIVAVPVMVGDDWYGFVALEDCERPRQWEQEVDLLQIAAAEIGAAIVNADLLADVQRHALELEERVAARTSELAAVNTELEAFAYSVSHDLRAPLHAIDGFSQALLEDYSAVLDGEGQDFLNRVRAASQRMGRLIDGLLRLSRVSRREMSREEVDVSALVRAIVAELEQRNERRGVEVVVADGLQTEGDADLLRIAFENLLGNAWKFSSGEPTPRIEVGSKRQSGELVLYVRDHGAGFDMAYADKLFGAFQRLHTDREFEGTGIGLATVQRIVHRHGGRVWASAAVGQGATFFLALPGSRLAPRRRL